MNISLLTPEDVDTCIGLGWMMHKESALGQITFDVPKMKQIAHACLNHPDWICYVAKQGEATVGMVVGFVGQYWFSKERYAMDLALYVHPEFRGSSAAFRLLKEFTTWASQQNIRQIRCGETTRVNPEATAKLYKKMGFEIGGQIFVRPVH